MIVVGAEATTSVCVCSAFLSLMNLSNGKKKTRGLYGINRKT